MHGCTSGLCRRDSADAVCARVHPGDASVKRVERLHSVSERQDTQAGVLIRLRRTVERYEKCGLPPFEETVGICRGQSGLEDALRGSLDVISDAAEREPARDCVEQNKGRHRVPVTRLSHGADVDNGAASGGDGKVVNGSGGDGVVAVDQGQGDVRVCSNAEIAIKDPERVESVLQGKDIVEGPRVWKGAVDESERFGVYSEGERCQVVHSGAAETGLCPEHGVPGVIVEVLHVNCSCHRQVVIAGDARDLEACDCLNTPVRVGPVPNQVAAAEDRVRSRAVNLRKDRSKGLVVAMNVGQECALHMGLVFRLSGRGPSGSVSEAEGGELADGLLRVRVGMGDVVLHCVPDLGDKVFKVLGTPLGDQFHSSVRQVPYVARNIGKAPGNVKGGIAEADALNGSRKDRDQTL